MRGCPFLLPIILLSACSPDPAPEKRDTVASAIARGDRLAASGEAEAAIAEYTRAIDLDAECAAAWFGRAMAKSDLNDSAGALADYTHAIELNLKDAMVYYRRGNEHKRGGDWSAAAADYSAALSINSRAEFFRARGHAFYALGEWDRAVADLENAARYQAAGEAVDYIQLELFLARARAGGRTAAGDMLKRHFAQTRATAESAWVRNLGSFVTGGMTANDLLLTATSGDAGASPSRLCEAAFYAGTIELLEGDTAGAEGLFSQCVENEIPGFLEPDLARAELKRLRNR